MNVLRPPFNPYPNVQVLDEKVIQVLVGGEKRETSATVEKTKESNAD
jgi:hypothetical protein